MSDEPTARDRRREVEHPYHCPLDGDRLIEIGLGMLACRRCKTQFVPTGGPSANEYGLSWIRRDGSGQPSKLTEST